MLWLFVADLLFCQQRSYWLFYNYRTWTSLFGMCARTILLWVTSYRWKSIQWLGSHRNVNVDYVVCNKGIFIHDLHFVYLVEALNTLIWKAHCRYTSPFSSQPLVPILFFYLQMSRIHGAWWHSHPHMSFKFVMKSPPQDWNT